MIVAPIDADREYDHLLEKVALAARKQTMESDDDFFLMCVGDTGTGKTSLMMHAYEAYDSDGCDVKYIGLDRASYAKAMLDASKKKKPRFCCNDEANINKRDSLTKFNKDMIDLYYANRGLNIWHWWNNPSLESMDKAFIKERVKGVILVFTKSMDKPRLYYYFHAAEILKLYEKYNSLSIKVLKESARKHAYYLGWFKPYKGKLWGPYLEKKQARMTSKVEDFYEKYGRIDGYKVISMQSMCNRIGISHGTLRNHQDKLLAYLVEGEDYIVDGVGRIRFVEEALVRVAEYFRGVMNNQHRFRV